MKWVSRAFLHGCTTPLATNAVYDCFCVSLALIYELLTFIIFSIRLIFTPNLIWKDKQYRYNEWGDLAHDPAAKRYIQSCP